jgi:hypothetical protein
MTTTRVQDGGLIPPGIGALWGKTEQSQAFTGAAVGWTDDNVIGSLTQTPSGTAANEFYCYWVNGTAQDVYYIVIQRQTLSFSPGSIIAKQPTSVGFFQYAFSVTNTVLDGSGNPLPAGSASLLSHSPSAFSPSPGTNPQVALSVPMVLLIDQGGSYSPTDFTATDTESVTLADWGIADNTANLTNSLLFHQVTTWDPTTAGPADWQRWYLNAYDVEKDATDNVLLPPATSYNSLELSVLLAWQFNVTGTPTAPPSLPLQFQTTVKQSLAAIHNPTACKTIITTTGGFSAVAGSHHITTSDTAYSALTTSTDLQKVVTGKGG